MNMQISASYFIKSVGCFGGCLGKGEVWAEMETLFLLGAHSKCATDR